MPDLWLIMYADNNKKTLITHLIFILDTPLDYISITFVQLAKQWKILSDFFSKKIIDFNFKNHTGEMRRINKWFRKFTFRKIILQIQFGHIDLNFEFNKQVDISRRQSDSGMWNLEIRSEPEIHIWDLWMYIWQLITFMDVYMTTKHVYKLG